MKIKKIRRSKWMPFAVGLVLGWPPRITTAAPRVVEVSRGAQDPAVSPDGGRIAVSILGKIFILPANGGEAQQITQGPSWDTHPAWSADGQFLAYSHQLPNGGEIIVVNLATGTSAVVHHTEHAIGQIAFTPSGGEIYFVVEAGQYDAHVWKIATNGEAAKQLTVSQNWHEWSFAVSPSGADLALVSGRFGGASLYMVTLDGFVPKRLTRSPSNDSSVAWSADGKTIAYVETGNGVDHVMLRPAAGGEAREVLSSAYDDKQIALEPNGTSAVLRAGRKLYRLRFADGKLEPIAFRARFTLPEAPPADLVVTHANLWDGTGAAASANATIEIRAGRVAAVRTGADATKVPAGVPVLDAAGKSVLPGLMDNHYHFWSPFDGASLLARGITTIRDPGVDVATSLNLKEAIALGLLAGPDVYTAGPLIDGYGGYHPMVDVEIDQAAAAAALVRSLKEQGVDLLKVYFLLDPAVLRAVVKEAHAQGLRVTGHIGVRTSWTQALADGIDGFNHIRIWPEFLPPAEQPQGEKDSLDAQKYLVARMQEDWNAIEPEGEKAGVLIAKMANAKIGFDPTLTVQKPNDFMKKAVGLEAFATAQETYKKMGRFVVRAQKGGVMILAGTDDGDLFDEIEAYTEAGMATTEALKAATGNGAKWLGKEAEFGTIEPGRRANLLIVEGDPSKDPKDLRKIAVVVKDGRIAFRK